MKTTTELNNGLTNEEKLRMDVLRRLNATCVVLLCSSFGVGAAKPGSKDKFTIGLAIRNELTNTDTPVTVTLHKGITVGEATNALNYVIDTIKEADRRVRADKNKNVGQTVKGRGFFALVTTIFTLPGYGLDRLVAYVKRKL